MSAKIKIAAYPRVSRRKAGGFSTESIGSKPKLDLSFCFSAARRWIVSTYQWCMNARNLRGIRFANAAPPKNKKNSFWVFRCYKQATLYGVSSHSGKLPEGESRVSRH